MPGCRIVVSMTTHLHDNQKTLSVVSLTALGDNFDNPKLVTGLSLWRCLFSQLWKPWLSPMVCQGCQSCLKSCNYDNLFLVVFMTTHWSPDNFDNLGWQQLVTTLTSRVVKKAPSQWQPSDNFWVVMVTTFGPSFALRVVKKGTVSVTTLTTQKWSIVTTFLTTRWQPCVLCACININYHIRERLPWQFSV